MSQMIDGIIHGRTIELVEETGFAEGQRVRVAIEPTTQDEPWGEAIRRTAGACADLPELDAVFQEIHHQRSTN